MTAAEQPALERAVVGALRSAIRDHGPITPDQVGSAAKRVLGNIRNARDASEILQRLYDSELHFDIHVHARWRAGFGWALVTREDLSPGASGSAETFEQAAHALGTAAARAFPASEFAAWWRSA